MRLRLLWRTRRLSNVLLQSWGYIIVIVLCCLLSGLMLRIPDILQQSYLNKRYSLMVNLRNNYLCFSPVKVNLLEENFSLLINKSQCRIPNFSISNEEVNEYHLNKGMYCRNSNVSITFVDGYTVRINEEALHKQGYNPENVACCYKTIIRLENKESERYYIDRDNKQRYSSHCYHFHKEIVPISGFIAVYCKLKGSEEIIYSNHHMVAVLPESIKYNQNDNCTLWGSNKSDSSFVPLPNVFVIGLDSTTRLNVRRNMPKTSALLEGKLGAVEMKGYTKVGDNTFPNLVPLLTSLHVKELIPTCYATWDTPFDNCPFIWKEFKKRDYLTVFVEDNPDLGTFNFARAGFHRAPVDIFARNFMIDTYKNIKDWPKKCSESHRHEKIILEYAANLAALSESRGIPYFIFIWLSEITHSQKNGAQRLDSLFVGALLDMQQRDLFENTFLFIIGDHGYRFGDFRTTITGWYEDKLPVLWVKPPEKMIKKSPVLLETLKLNSLQTTTAFDVYTTFKDILNPLSTSPPPPKVVLKGNSSKTRLRGLSLLKKLPERSCNEAGIPEIQCPCVMLEEYNNEKVLYLGASTVISYINARVRELTFVCSPLSLVQIFAAGIVWENSVEGELGEPKGFLLYVGLTAIPGEFKFEAVVKFKNESDTLPTIIEVLRTSQVENRINCLQGIKNGPNHAYLVQFCFCKR